MFGTPKQETPQSPLDKILSAFTEQAIRMHALLGFPGVLLLLAIVFVALPTIPGVGVSSSLTVLAATSLLGSVATYVAECYYALRRAEAQARILENYTRMFLDRYLASKGTVGAEEVHFAIDYILMPLLEKPHPTLPPKSGSPK